MLLAALKPDRMGAERAHLLNREQRRPFVVTHSVSQSDFLHLEIAGLIGRLAVKESSDSEPRRGAGESAKI